jgi:hypothetical protein
MAKSKYDLATIFFIGIIIFSALGAIVPITTGIVWLILAICGAMVAIQNIRISEENPFLIGVIALVTILTAFLIIPEFRFALSSQLGVFFFNLLVGFGVAGFIVAVGVVSRLSLKK